MNKIMRKITAGAVLGACLCGITGAALAQSTPPAVAQHQQQEITGGEPARWLKGDASMQAQVATKRKEISAALNEALDDCRKAAANERKGCVQQARETYTRDMANVNALVAQSNTMGGVHETAGPSE
jgi:hypothetical protein